MQRSELREVEVREILRTFALRVGGGSGLAVGRDYADAEREAVRGIYDAMRAPSKRRGAVSRGSQ